MMRKNIDKQAQRRRDAIQSAIVSTLMLIVPAAVMLLLRWFCRAEGIVGAVLVIFSVLDLGMVIPIWILLKNRLKEIEGGEEDAAAQY
ncbi:MAG: hypothetical protein Q4D50_04835 [Eubacteriales bacterium]|nr:hypothetical protein [Eubacteriales bacterium]